jgi:hypothetical protein
MIRSLGSVPIAENMSAYRATCAVLFLAKVGIFRDLQKYGEVVKSWCVFPRSPDGAGRLAAFAVRLALQRLKSLFRDDRSHDEGRGWIRPPPSESGVGNNRSQEWRTSRQKISLPCVRFHRRLPGSSPLFFAREGGITTANAGENDSGNAMLRCLSATRSKSVVQDVREGDEANPTIRRLRRSFCWHAASASTDVQKLRQLI